MYDDYKFVTRAELSQLGLSHLVGSTLLRAYLHGFFMDQRLYNEVRCLPGAARTTARQHQSFPQDVLIDTSMPYPTRFGTRRACHQPYDIYQESMS